MYVQLRRDMSFVKDIRPALLILCGVIPVDLSARPMLGHNSHNWTWISINLSNNCMGLYRDPSVITDWSKSSSWTSLSLNMSCCYCLYFACFLYMFYCAPLPAICLEYCHWYPLVLPRLNSWCYRLVMAILVNGPDIKVDLTLCILTRSSMLINPYNG